MYGNGRKAYLSAIVDGYDNSVVSWVLSHSNNNKLVMNTVKKAFKRNPNAMPLLHSDRGIFNILRRNTNNFKRDTSLQQVCPV
ncbi:DDE-type integrase/transposase/recombinase [Paenibacillus sp. oral taxon 786]|uniref:DDE-type integrase/transposase/recombinase n=1 Tax=Paenibacillus sp. oral taxon 786 TaxID=652715 RepID=UPI00031C323F